MKIHLTQNICIHTQGNIQSFHCLVESKCRKKYPPRAGSCKPFLSARNSYKPHNKTAMLIAWTA